MNAIEEIEKLIAIRINRKKFVVPERFKRDITLEEIRRNPIVIRLSNDPTKEIQKLAIDSAFTWLWPSMKEQDEIILTCYYCPDWRDWAEEIWTNLVIKDIIE
jgi:hypothetical protein